MMHLKPHPMSEQASASTSSFFRVLLPVVEAALRRVVTARDPEFEDLLQSVLEAVLAAMRKERFRGESSLSTWASAIARNVAIDALRSRSRERRVFSSQKDLEEAAAQSQSNSPSPELMADVRQQLSHYHEALQSLCLTKAQVVYFSDVLGHGLEEIAATLGISVAATQSRLVRGRKEIADTVASFERRDADPPWEERTSGIWGTESSASTDRGSSPPSARSRMRRPLSR
jgi:RNA polymerase sigma factor (sigma-70 family)